MNIIYNFMNTDNTQSIYQTYLKSFLIELRYTDFDESSLVTVKRILEYKDTKIYTIKDF